jgi:hypothetical protein
MKYRVTPFCLGRAILAIDAMASLAREGRHTVQALSAYDERPTIEVEAVDIHAACEAAWATYQNVDEDRKCPDGGRSLMVGDMARVEADSVTHWMICCSIGWTETVVPSDEVQRIGS